MADKPTYEQQLVIDDRGGKLLVSAAAGSGKTKVLVDRVLKYIMDPCDPANIDDFLIITFTQDAAAELRMKISKALTEKIAQTVPVWYMPCTPDEAAVQALEAELRKQESL